MVVGMLLMGLISLGLPLLGWWVGGRSMVLRMISRDQAGSCAAAVRGRALAPEQLARVRCAMTSGRRLDDPAERAAVVCWGRSVIADDAARASRHPRLHRALLVAVLLWGAALATIAVLVLVQGHTDRVPVIPIVWWLLFAALTLHHRLTVRRAVRRNSDPADDRVSVTA